MDPNAALRGIREAATLIRELEDLADPDSGEFERDTQERIVEQAQALTEYVQTLDQWITKGGFLPAAWARRQL